MKLSEEGKEKKEFSRNHPLKSKWKKVLLNIRDQTNDEIWKKLSWKSKFHNTKEAIDINGVINESILASNKHAAGKFFKRFVGLCILF